MTSQGHAYGRLMRALDRGTATMVLAAASDLPQISLGDALGVTLALRDDERYNRAASRWCARLALEHPVSLADSQLAASALSALKHGSLAPAGLTLLELCQRYQVADAERHLTRWLDRQGVEV